mmetsp:Transcript_11956/g.25700  ORF Transcript_11956/g.25700 Transcript_11956/m.25700 type:complete len:222 (-) Transcript_11956:596-1261(-)
MSVWRCPLKNDSTSRISSSNPPSTMRSASSRHRYLQMSRFMRLLCSRSFRRPGVATTMCTPCFRMSYWVLGSTPPIHSMARSSGYPSSTSALQYCSMISCVWLASSREGQMMRPTGPSLRMSGMRISSCSAIMIMGSVKTSVLPEPVKAMPIMSRPASATGRPWIWMGVGFLMPLASSTRSTAGGNFMSLKFAMGGGTSLPSIAMRKVSRICCRASSDIWR